MESSSNRINLSGKGGAEITEWKQDRLLNYDSSLK